MVTYCYLVTGGAGFIGSHLVDELVRREQRVKVLDDLSTGRLENLTQVLDDIELIEGDIRDQSAVRAAVKGVDYVLHLAALASVSQSVADPLTTNEVNVTGTLNVLLAARDAGVKRVVFASSCAVYGDSPALPLNEEVPTRPLSPYAASKLAGEDYCLAFYEVFSLPTVSLNGEPLTIYGDGAQSRDFVYVSNVVAAVLLACQAPAAAGQVINISCGERYSLLDLVSYLKPLLTGHSLRVEHLDPRPGDVRHSQGDIQKARLLLGYEPLVELDAGLVQTVGLMGRAAN
jgi:UDP-glucose 4-epimerase